MNNICLLKQPQNTQESLLEIQIYKDLYEYKAKDNINLKMLISVILNSNIELFKKVIENKKLTSEETEKLLEIIVEEGDSHLLYFLMLFENLNKSPKNINKLIEKALISNSFAILEILLKNNNKLNISIINKVFEKNPNLKLLEFLTDKFNTNRILNNKILNIIFNGDYLDIFKYFINKKESLNLNQLLNSAILNHSYQITYYIINEINEYKINKKSNYYNEFFDFLITEDFEKVILFLRKSDNIFKFGSENLEKLLMVFNEKSKIEHLLFEHNLVKIKLKDKDLKNQINKYILENKLNKTLKQKNIKTHKKIIKI